MEKDVTTSSEELSDPARKIIAEINARLAKNNPNIGKTQSVILKNGPQAYKIAIIYEILNASSKEHHHTVLSIQTWKYKAKEDFFEEKINLNINLDNKKETRLVYLEILYYPSKKKLQKSQMYTLCCENNITRS